MALFNGGTPKDDGEHELVDGQGQPTDHIAVARRIAFTFALASAQLDELGKLGGKEPRLQRQRRRPKAISPSRDALGTASARSRCRPCATAGDGARSDRRGRRRIARRDRSRACEAVSLPDSRIVLPHGIEQPAGNLVPGPLSDVGVKIRGDICAAIGVAHPSRNVRRRRVGNPIVDFGLVQPDQHRVETVSQWRTPTGPLSAGFARCSMIPHELPDSMQERRERCDARIALYGVRRFMRTGAQPEVGAPQCRLAGRSAKQRSSGSSAG
jgi:hypothetical protein